MKKLLQNVPYGVIVKVERNQTEHFEGGEKNESWIDKNMILQKQEPARDRKSLWQREFQKEPCAERQADIR